MANLLVSTNLDALCAVTSVLELALAGDRAKLVTTLWADSRIDLLATLDRAYIFQIPQIDVRCILRALS